MNTTQFIERVADKRHARLCLTMPEPQAAQHIVDYLAYMEGVCKDSPHNLHFVRALKSAYEVTA